MRTTTQIDEEDAMTTDVLTSAEIRAVRELLDVHAIQEVMLRYVRSVDRRDPDLVKTIFWDGATDDHGNYSGSAEGFMQNAIDNVRGVVTCYHNLAPARVDFVGDTQAKVESYFLFVGTYDREEGVMYATNTG